MRNKTIITNLENRLLAFSFENEACVEIQVISNKEGEWQVGDIFTGRINNIIPNIKAAFVTIGDEQCYYSLEDNKHTTFLNVKKDNTPHVNDEILVQIEREASKSKNAGGSCYFNLTGEFLVLTYHKKGIGISKKIGNEEYRRLRADMEKVLLHLQNEYEESELCGFIVRTSGANASFSQLLADADSLIKQLQSLMFKAKSSVSGKCLYKSKSVLREIMNRTGIGEDSAVITDDEAIYKQLERENENRFAKVNIEFYNNELPLKAVYELEHILKEAVAKKVWLKGGGYLILEPTEALTVIDVNSGKDIKGRDNKEEHILKVNLQAAKEIARQIMLRNYSGIIIVDFIDMKKAEHKKELLKYLKEQLLMDSVKTVLVDITRLGLVEITRRKLKKPLYEQWRDFKDN